MISLLRQSGLLNDGSYEYHQLESESTDEEDKSEREDEKAERRKSAALEDPYFIIRLVVSYSIGETRNRNY